MIIIIITYFFRVTYYIEFLSLKLRGLCVVLLALWWAIGSILAALLALAVMPNSKETQSI